ncbi:MAG: hypothetical protein IJS66_06230 [Bacteroidales bacterium]|nr:hypothetical protein [Bacteroidales bacterium]
MKKTISLVSIVFSFFLLMLPASLSAQKKVYTKSMRMQDFKSRTTMVVLSGPAIRDAALRAEVTSRWSVSPYAFCTPAEYEKLKSDPERYFLHTQKERGVLFLTLSKGGDPDSEDTMKKPLDIVSMPFCGEFDESGREAVYLPAYLSILQDFVEAALDSETKAYMGLKGITRKLPKRWKLYEFPDEADRAFKDREPHSAVTVIISPDGAGASKPRYKMTIDTEDYSLYHYGK